MENSWRAVERGWSRKIAKGGSRECRRAPRGGGGEGVVVRAVGGGRRMEEGGGE